MSQCTYLGNYRKLDLGAVSNGQRFVGTVTIECDGKIPL